MSGIPPPSAARAARLIKVALAVLVTGCSAGGAPDPAPASPAPGFHNPVYGSDFPDPMILATGDHYLAVATNGSGGNVPSLTSPNLVTWSPGADLLPELPRWTTPGEVWAPEIAAGPEGFLLYYTTRVTAADRQCIGLASAAQVTGPYADRRAGPLVCQPGRGGSIDPHPFTARDGQRYLFWKNDGNAVGEDTALWAQPLSADGRELTGRARRVLEPDQDWEGSLVEAPYVVEEGGRFHLFYSANGYATAEYAVGHAVADSPLGPYVKDPDPVLSGNGAAGGPGHCALVARNGRWWMAYHAWPPDRIGEDEPDRTLWLSEVRFAADGSVQVEAPVVDHPGRP